MQPSVQEARPPYVVFEDRAVEDRDASIAAGKFIAKSQHFAVITPAGSKDRIERLAHEWLPYLDEQVRQQRFPQEWAAGYRQAYERWAKNQEVPESGTPIAAWPPLNPALVKNMLTWNVRTVEDLAAANEETLSRLGMGSRDWKKRAIEWLSSAKDVGQSSEKIVVLEQKLEESKEENKGLRERLVLLEQQMAGMVAGQAIGRAQSYQAPDDSLDLNDLLDTQPAVAPRRL